MPAQGILFPLVANFHIRDVVLSSVFHTGLFKVSPGWHTSCSTISDRWYETYLDYDFRDWRRGMRVKGGGGNMMPLIIGIAVILVLAVLIYFLFLRPM